MDFNERLFQSQDYDVLLNEVYSYLQQLTDGETDKELQQYNDYLLDGLQDTMKYISYLNEMKQNIPYIRGKLCKIEQKLQSSNHIPITGSMANKIAVIDESINEIKELKESMRTCIKDKKE